MRILSRVVSRTSQHWRVGLEVLATLLVIAVCLNLLWQGGRAGPIALAGPPPPPVRSEPKLPVEPVSLDGAMIQGSKVAKVALIQYSDFECPFCGKFARETEPALRTEYIATGRVLYAFRHLPLDRIHDYAVKAAITAACAGEQGKFWQMHDLLFQSPEKLNDVVIGERAKAAALDERALGACTVGPGAERVKQDVAEAMKLGITGTPTLLVGAIQSDGRVKVTQRISGAQPIERLRAAIDAVLGTGKVAGQ